MHGNVMRLVNYENRWGEGPNDKLFILREVTLDANGEGVIDLDTLLKPDAVVDFFVMSRTAINNSDAQAFGTAGITINSGGMPVALAAVAAAAPVPAVVIPAASVTVMVVIIVDANMLAESGD